MTKTLKAPIAALAGTALMSAAAASFAASAGPLPAPDKALSAPLMQALSDRASTREFAPGELSEQSLANLLWASLGVNRPDGRRTSPTALNKQDVEVYVLTSGGAFHYDAPKHSLEKVSAENLLPLVARQQQFVETAAAALVFVSDTTRFPGDSIRIGALDAGMAAQNAVLYCAAEGLACVPRTTMDREALRKALGLADGAEPMINVVAGLRK